MITTSLILLGPLKESQIVNCTRQILLGLKYLHDNSIAHRDIKCANCLLTKKGHVKLADFGASKKFETESLVSGLKGTPNWMSPEVITIVAYDSIITIVFVTYKINIHQSLFICDPNRSSEELK